MTPEAAFAELAAQVEPPEQPARPREIDWAAFERENGFAAPTDYRLLLERYGVGSFDVGGPEAGHGWLDLLDPFAPGQTLAERSEWDRRNARGLQRQFPDQYPGWPMWPQPGGLLPWGNSIDGDVVGWWTTGVPDEWGTRFFGRANEFEEFPFGIAEFLVRLLRGELGAPSLDGRLDAVEPGDAPSFYPLPPSAPTVATHGLDEEVTVTFAGLASVIDPAAIPPHPKIAVVRDAQEHRASMDEWQRLWADATRPADDILESWMEELKALGFQLRSWGVMRMDFDDPYRHVLSFAFAPSSEDAVKRKLVELAERLGVGIAEVRNLEYERVWEDLTVPAAD